MILGICLLILLITVFLAAYFIGKALDLKYKDDHLFTNISGNGFGYSFTDDKDEFVIKDKIDNEKK